MRLRSDSYCTVLLIHFPSEYIFPIPTHTTLHWTDADDATTNMSGHEASSKRLTLLDRSIVTVLTHSHPPDHTPSRAQGISAREERLYRLHGTGLLREACCMVLAVPKIYPTATVLFHRFLHQVSLKEIDVWSLAMACTLLAAKIEEIVSRVSVRNIVLTFVHLYRRRTLLLESNPSILQKLIQHPRVAVSIVAASMSFQEKQERVEREVPSLSMMGPIWKEWHTAVVQAESRLLRQLGFTVYWIPEQHPHRFVQPFCNALQIDTESQTTLVVAALQYCDIACRLDLAVRFQPQLIACAAIYISLPILKNSQSTACRNNVRVCWWHIFCGNTHDREISTIANAILGLESSNGSNDDDVDVANKTFLISHCTTETISHSSFNDPKSFVYTMLVENVVLSTTE